MMIVYIQSWREWSFIPHSKTLCNSSPIKKKKIQYTYAAFLNASMTYISFEDTVLLNIKGVVAGVKVTLWWVYKFFNGSVK